MLKPAAEDIGRNAEHLVKLPPKTDVHKDNRPVTQCVIVGYVSGTATGRPFGILVASTPEGKLVYAGLVRKGWNRSPRRSKSGWKASMIGET